MLIRSKGGIHSLLIPPVTLVPISISVWGQSPQNLCHSCPTDIEVAGDIGTIFGNAGVNQALVEPSEGQGIAVNTLGFGRYGSDRFRATPGVEFDYLLSP